MTPLKTRPTAAALAAGAALLLLPAAGSASQTFGSRLNHDPTTADCGALMAPCTIASYIVPTDPNGDPSSAGAPADGVIVKLRIRAFGEVTPAQVTFRLADVTLPNPGDNTAALATAAGTGPTGTVPVDSGGETPITEFPARLSVKKGNHLAVDGGLNLKATYDSSGSKLSYAFAPPLVQGQGARGSSSVTGELLVQAIMEPDLDGDGFGDETQDQCPSQSVTQGLCTPPPPLPHDTTAPAISALRVGGGTISYTLSEAAAVNFVLAKATTGRKVDGTCVRRTHKNRHRPHCTRFARVGRAFGGPGKAGAEQLALPKPGGHKLGPGLYRLTTTARDGAGNKRTVTKRFRIRSAS